jgi:uncharacterized protein YcfL
LNKLMMITILILPFILLGCSSNTGVQQNNVQEKVNGTLVNAETTWSTVPTPSTIVVYSQGKSKSVQTSNPKYIALAKEIETLLKNSNISEGKHMYTIALPQNGDISEYRWSGVELVYDSPFDLTIYNRKISIFRLFIRCSEKQPMLFVGVKNTDDYYGSGLGSLVINNTDALKQLVENIFGENGTKVEFKDITVENPNYYETIVGGLKDGGCYIQTIEGHANTNYYILYFKKWKPYSNINILNTDSTIKINYEEKTTDQMSDSVISFSLPSGNKKVVELYKKGKLVQDNIKLGYGIE